MKSLRRRLWTGFGGMLLILVLVSALSIVVLTRYSHALERVFRENYDSAVYCDAMKDALERLDVGAQRRVWGAPADDQAEVARQIARFEQSLHRQLDNCTLPGELDATRGLADRWTGYRAQYLEFTGADGARLAEIYRRDLLPGYEGLKQLAQQIADMNMRNMVSVDGRAKRTLVAVRNALLVLVSVGTLLAALLVGAVAATILGPLKSLTHCAREIGRGNFEPTIRPQSSDEVGQLAEAFNAMAGRLREFRRLDQERLTRTEQATQLAIDSLADPVLLVGPNRKVEIANRAAQRHLAINPGVKIDELRLGWLTGIFDAVWQSREASEPQGYASALQVFEEGHERFLLPRAVPVAGDAGTVLGVTIILMDVTRLRYADELKSGLLATVSHELRTPLTSARMALGLLTGEKLGVLAAPQAKLLTAARQDVERLYRIIESLLSASRIEAGRDNIQPQPLSAMDVISLGADPLRGLAAERGRSLLVEVPGDLPRVWADPTSVGYAIGNLIANAIEYSTPGGTIGVWVREEDHMLRFGVDDTGPGIAPEHAAHIFERSYRLPRDRGRRGAGLGLTIARQIVEAHRGRIFLSTNSQGGSTFSFTLPVAPASSGAGERASPVSVELG